MFIPSVSCKDAIIWLEFRQIYLYNNIYIIENLSERKEALPYVMCADGITSSKFPTLYKNRGVRFTNNQYINTLYSPNFNINHKFSLFTYCRGDGSCPAAYFGNKDIAQNYKGFELGGTNSTGSVKLDIMDTLASKDIEVVYPGKNYDYSFRASCGTYDGTATRAGVKIYRDSFKGPLAGSVGTLSNINSTRPLLLNARWDGSSTLATYTTYILYFAAFFDFVLDPLQIFNLEKYIKRTINS
jgi:hypothetical protein